MNTYSFPTDQTLTDDYLKENFWRCLYTSAEEPLHYWIVLPNHVKPTKLEPSPIKQLGLVNIGQYNRIGDAAYLEVQVVYEHSPYEMNASDWLLKKLYLNGETIIDFREIKGQSTGTYIDVLCRKVLSGDQEVISRCTVIKNFDELRGGANYFCVKCSCDGADYEQQALSILQIVSNWDMTHKGDWQMAERLYPFAYPFTEPVSFYVPESWEIKFDTENTGSLARFTMAHNVGEMNHGMLNVHFYDSFAAKAPDGIYQKSSSRLSSLKREVGELNTFPNQNPHILGSWALEGIVSQEEENFKAQISVLIIQTLKGWYYFEMIGPRPNLVNYYWEINKRCLELILDSFNNSKLEMRPESSVGPGPVTPDEVVPINPWLPKEWNTLAR